MNNTDVNEEKKSRTVRSAEEQMKDFEAKLERAEKVATKLSLALNGFIFDFKFLEDVTDSISLLVTEYENLNNGLDVIKSEIANNRSNISKETIRGWTGRIDKLRNSIKDIKKAHIIAYNTSIIHVNNEIERLNSLDNLPDELVSFLNELRNKKLSIVDYSINNYNDVAYLKLLKHKDLINLIGQIYGINKVIEENNNFTLPADMDDNIDVSYSTEHERSRTLTPPRNLFEINSENGVNSDMFDDKSDDLFSAPEIDEDNEVESTDEELGSRDISSAEFDDLFNKPAIDDDNNNERIIDSSLDSLDARINDLSVEIDEFVNEPEFDKSKVNEIRNSILDVENEILLKKINSCSLLGSGSLDENEYNDLNSKLNGYKEKIDNLDRKFSAFIEKKDTYLALKNKEDILVERARKLLGTASAVTTDDTTEKHTDVLNEEARDLEKNLSSAHENVTEHKSELNDDQENNLNSGLADIEKEINTATDAIDAANEVNEEKENHSVKNKYSDNKHIGKLVKNLEKLKVLLGKTKKPIKLGKRKVINSLINECQKNIDRINKNFAHMKKINKKKYNSDEMLEIRSYFEAIKKGDEDISFNKLKNDYVSKCPPGVKRIRQASHLIKGNKRLCLIGAGLAAVAITHATVGPVLIPAIMRGNIMFAVKWPGIKSLFNGLNDKLGSLINATKSPGGIWRTASGSIINPAGGTSSLLKGIALSAGATGLGVGAMITGVKMIAEEIKYRTRNMNFRDKDGKSKVGKAAKAVKDTGVKYVKKAGDAAKKPISMVGHAGSAIHEHMSTNREGKDFASNPEFLADLYLKLPEKERNIEMEKLQEDYPEIYKNVCDLIEEKDKAKKKKKGVK